MLITGIESDYEPRGELVMLNCEVLEEFGDISEHFTGFPNAGIVGRFPWSCEKSDCTT